MVGMERVGLTTTAPVEVILAAGMVPVDLNNTFIASENPAGLVDQAEAEGLPRTTCGWIKGLYLAARGGPLSGIIAVTQGDCSNTHALMELWQAGGFRIIPFAYPYDRDIDLLRLQMHKLMDALGADEASTIRQFGALRPLRKRLSQLDELTWRTGQVRGHENHRWLISASDFEGEPASFEARLDGFLDEAGKRDGIFTPDTIRIGYVGVPPIFTDLYTTLESLGAPVVFNETQRQFAMPYETDDIYEQYARYTYPYDVFGRIADIREQASLRKIDGIIHYCQSFCFHAIEDLLIRRGLKLPILTIEGDRPGPVDARTRIRLEGFVEMLRDRRGLHAFRY